MDKGVGSFWDHLDELRGVLVRVAVGCLVMTLLAFLFKDQLFAVLFAPRDSNFVTFRLLDSLSQKFSLGEAISGVETFGVELINTELTQQFITHITVSIYVGLLALLPYLLYELFRFISPALYDDERRYAVSFVVSGYVMFLLGVLLNYFLIFPLTFRFLATYQVSVDVVNMISLSSYMGTFMVLSMMMGVMFEMPLLGWLLARLGLLKARFMREYRRHSFVVLLFVSAVITPTVDITTLMLVAVPIYILYEVTILVVGMAEGERNSVDKE